MNILFLCTTDFLSLYVVRALSGESYTCYGMGPSDVGDRYSRFWKRYVVCDTASLERGDKTIIIAINAVCRDCYIDVIVPLDIPSSLGVTAIKKYLTCFCFPLAHADTIRLFANKWATKTFITQLGIPHPNTLLIRNSHELARISFPRPFFIKPTMQGGGRGIVRITNERELQRYLETKSPYKTFPLMVQEEITGEDIDISVLAYGGNIVAWTVQQWKEPGVLEFVENKEALNIAGKIVTHSGYSGLMHIDLRKDRRTDNLVVFECNPRAWGSINASIYAGVDFIGLGIQYARNKQIKFFKAKHITYETPIHMLKKITKHFLHIPTISRASKRDFIRMFTDPIPYLALGGKVLKERIMQRSL